MVNIYLVDDGRGVTMIDAGLPGHWDELVAELAAMGRSLQDVRAVVLTHGDTDHRGVAERLRRDRGVPVYVHEADASLARGETTKKVKWGRLKIGPLLSFMWYATRRSGWRVPGVSEVTTLSGGETLDLPGDPRIIPLPGHTPGSVAVHVPSHHAVFVGDALTTRHVLTGVEGPQPAPFTLDEEAALESLTKLESLDVTWVLPGHGPPWRGGTSEVVEGVRSFGG